MFGNIYHTVYYSVLIATALSSIWFLFKVEGKFSVLGILIILTLFSELLAKYVAVTYKVSNNIIYHFFTPLEYLLYVILFVQYLKFKPWNYIVKASVPILVLCEILNTLWFQPLHYSNTNIMILESVFLVFFSLLLFLQIKDSVQYDDLLKEGVFWFNSAILIYYAFNILVWGFHSFKIYNLTNPPVIIYHLNLIFSAMLYATFTFALYLEYKSRKKLPQEIANGS